MHKQAHLVESLAVAGSEGAWIESKHKADSEVTNQLPADIFETCCRGLAVYQLNETMVAHDDAVERERSLYAGASFGDLCR